MANANTVTTLDAVHAGIVSAIRAQFPTLKTVEAYRLDRKNLPVPACLIEMTEMDAAPEIDPGTEQLAITARFEARFVIGFRQGGNNPKLEVRKLAASFAAFARLKRWGCPIGPAEVIGAYQDDFDPELDQFECWRVEWQQVIHLGDTVWKDEGEVPTPFFSYTPMIGEGNAGHYTDLEGNAP
jgi:hypothetical protein